MFDLLLALIIIVLFFPVLLIIYVILFIQNRGEVIFTQDRGGYKGKVFGIYKFKTMITAYDEKGELLGDDKRLTRVGKILRNYSLDELPSLFNIIKGEMSFVGPRPFISKYLPLYNSYQLQRHNVKPGLSGWAQIKGRNAIDWEKKFEYDIWYVNNCSFWLDIKIVFLTVYKVFTKDGISTEGHVTTVQFKGNVDE
jgi:lipopolysaccharide/colanic/teichoic acid biosynthesis glycosyltransferase